MGIYMRRDEIGWLRIRTRCDDDDDGGGDDDNKTSYLLSILFKSCKHKHRTDYFLLAMNGFSKCKCRCD